MAIIPSLFDLCVRDLVNFEDYIEFMRENGIEKLVVASLFRQNIDMNGDWWEEFSETFPDLKTKIRCQHLNYYSLCPHPKHKVERCDELVSIPVKAEHNCRICNIIFCGNHKGYSCSQKKVKRTAGTINECLGCKNHLCNGCILCLVCSDCEEKIRCSICDAQFEAYEFVHCDECNRYFCEKCIATECPFCDE